MTDDVPKTISASPYFLGIEAKILAVFNATLGAYDPADYLEVGFEYLTPLLHTVIERVMDSALTRSDQVAECAVELIIIGWPPLPSPLPQLSDEYAAEITSSWRPLVLHSAKAFLFDALAGSKPTEDFQQIIDLWVAKQAVRAQ